jgi:uncharacterized membrane protein
MDAPSDASSGAPTAQDARRPELFYRIALLGKGLDGLIELLAGMALWLAPGMLVWVLAQLERTDLDDRSLRILIAEWAHWRRVRVGPTTARPTTEE